MWFEVVFPVLNEEKRLPAGVRRTLEFLEGNMQEMWTVVIADNGSADATKEVSQRLVDESSGRLRYRKIAEPGVGGAIRDAWNSSKADVVGYMDIDLATDLRHLKDVEELFYEPAVAVVNGSRLLPTSRVAGRPAVRAATSRGLNLLMKSILRVGFTDAMCGFKFFRRGIAVSLLEDIPTIPDWFVAAELLVRAEWVGYSVREIPVYWEDDPNSKARIGKLAKQYLGHIARLRREMASRNGCGRT